MSASYDPYNLTPMKAKKSVGAKTKKSEPVPVNNKPLPIREEGEAVSSIAVGQLRSFIERIEGLEEEKKTVSEDIKCVYAELKGSGFDAKAVRTIIRMRKQDDTKRQEEETMLRLYADALGMPLFRGLL